MSPRRTSITPFLIDLHWLNIPDRIKFKTLVYVFKSLNGFCPRYIDDCLKVKRPSTGSVTTRSGHGLNLLVPKTQKCAGDRAFSVAAPQIWNHLPIHLRRATNIDSFKSLLKTYLFNASYYKNLICNHLWSTHFLPHVE